MDLVELGNLLELTVPSASDSGKYSFVDCENAFFNRDFEKAAELALSSLVQQTDIEHALGILIQCVFELRGAEIAIQVLPKLHNNKVAEKAGAGEIPASLLLLHAQLLIHLKRQTEGLHLVDCWKIGAQVSREGTQWALTNTEVQLINLAANKLLKHSKGIQEAIDWVETFQSIVVEPELLNETFAELAKPQEKDPVYEEEDDKGPQTPRVVAPSTPTTSTTPTPTTTTQTPLPRKEEMQVSEQQGWWAMQVFVSNLPPGLREVLTKRARRQLLYTMKSRIVHPGTGELTPRAVDLISAVAALVIVFFLSKYFKPGILAALWGGRTS
eukprot:TRINITY_DN21433_c0_g1_i1.p1 TRINITY_DN21433_c0_g1~~TRINITY_DN21433_c0_g1_i1.p1  ORF type:complete len:335 (-),score=59.94 TRINITY_DN21433_c0_g1_i1:79-1059(-)